MRLDPRDARSHLNLAVLYVEKGSSRDARDEISSALSLRPGYSQALDLLKTLNQLDERSGPVR